MLFDIKFSLQFSYEVQLLQNLYRFGGAKPLFISFSSLFTVHSYKFIHTHSFITFAEFRSSFFIGASSGRGSPHWDAEPRFELGAALQQPDTLPTEPCRTLTDPCRTFFRIVLATILRVKTLRESCLSISITSRNPYVIRVLVDPA